MALIAATCPNCGATLQLNDRLEKATCSYCDSIIIVEDEIEKNNINITTKISMTGEISAENDIEYGLACLAVHDWRSAFDAFVRAINKEVDNYEAWLGCLNAYTRNHTVLDESLLNTSGIYGIKSVVKNCIKYAPDDKRKKIVKDIRKLLDKINSKEDEIYNSKLNAINNQYLIYKNKLIILSIFALSFLLLSILFLAIAWPFCIISGIPLIIFASKSIKVNHKRRETKDTELTKNNKLMKLLGQLNKVVNEASA